MERNGKLALWLLVGVDGRRHSIGNQRLQPAGMAPVLDDGGIVQKIRDVGLVIDLEADHLAPLAPCDQQCPALRALPAAIDIVAEQNLDDALRRIGGDVGEKLRQEIGASVHVADSVDANAVRRLRCGLLAGARQQTPHESLTYQ
jgi:hypothetical protein